MLVLAAAISTGLVLGATTNDRMAKIELAQEAIKSGTRTDGNALLIQQMLEFYLSFSGQDTSKAPEMLSYGCFCQILGERQEGKGKPRDDLDEYGHGKCTFIRTLI